MNAGNLAVNLDRVVSKLNSMMGTRYGVSVEYIDLSDKSQDGGKAIETVKRNAEAPMIVAHNQLLVPVKLDGLLVGATRVKKINLLKPKELSQVKDTLDLVFLCFEQRGMQVAVAADEIEGFDAANVIRIEDRREAKEIPAV